MRTGCASSGLRSKTGAPEVIGDMLGWDCHLDPQLDTSLTLLLISLSVVVFDCPAANGGPGGGKLKYVWQLKG